MKISNSNQSGLRERLLDFHNQKGVKWIFIADKLEISKFTMSDFKAGRANLHDGPRKRLEEYLGSEGF